ncbi:uncharacterized protein [Pleurodeles waltl]|uniref:uncharacterized protein n=1 Tax=Pleurodeles waltl TaxID=8319 RepID=UPI003709847B
MEHPKGISSDELQSEDGNDLDTPRTKNLNFLRSKRLAFFTGEKARSSCGKNVRQSSLGDKNLKNKATESSNKQKQTPRLCEPQQIKCKQDNAVQEAPPSHSFKQKQETMLSLSDTNRSVVLNLDSCLVEGTCVPEVQKLSHVMEKSSNTTEHKDCSPKHNHEADNGIQETPRPNLLEKNACFLVRSFVSGLEDPSLEDLCVSEKHKSRGSTEESTESTSDHKETPRPPEPRQDNHELHHYTQEATMPYLHRLKKETMFTQPKSDRSVMRRSYVSDLDDGLLDDVHVPETQKLKHVMGWAQKFLKKRECEDDIEASATVSESDEISPITGDNRTPNIRKEDTKRLQLSKRHQSHDYKSSPSSEVCLSSYLGKNQNTKEGAASLYFCKDSILASEKKYQYDIKEKKGWKEEANINISGVKSDSEDSLVQLGGLHEYGNNRCTMHSLPMCMDSIHTQSNSGTFSIHDKSISRTPNPAQDFNYFWVPPDDSSEDEFELGTKKSNITFNTDNKEFYRSSYSTLSQNHEHLPYLSNSNPESSSSSIQEPGNITREGWNTTQKWMSDNLQQYKHTDYTSLYKDSHFFEGKFSESETKKQFENSSFFVEHYLKKDDNKTLTQDFTPPYTFIGNRSKAAIEHGDMTDRTFIVNNMREGKTVTRVFDFKKDSDTTIYSKKEHKQVGPIICTNEPGITGSRSSLRVAVKPHEEISDKQCPICSTANTSDSNWCAECGSILVGNSPGTDKSHRNSLTKGIMTADKLSSRTGSESTECSESSSEEIFRLKKGTLDHKKLCWDNDSDVISNIGSSVLDKYYYCMNRLSRDGKQASSLSKDSSVLPLESYSKSQLLITNLEDNRIEKDLAFESEASDCGDEELHTNYGNTNVECFGALHPTTAGSNLENVVGDSKIFHGKSELGKDLLEV